MKKINFLSLIVFFTIIFNNLAAFSCQERSPEHKLKSNIFLLESMLKKYSNIHSGYYPKNIEELKNHAIKNNYWEKMRNPYDIGFSILSDKLINKNDLNIEFANKNFSRGTIIYNAKINKNKKVKGYYIYAIKREKSDNFFIDNIDSLINTVYMPPCRYIDYYNKRCDFLKQDYDTNKPFFIEK